MRLDDLAGGPEAQPEPAVVLRRHRAFETSEDALLLRGGNADPAVADGYAGQLARRPSTLHANLDRLAFAELRRVRDEVPNGRIEAIPIPKPDDRFVPCHRSRRSGHCDRMTESVQCRGDHLAQVDAHGHDGLSARSDPRDVEEVVDEGRQPLDVARAIRELPLQPVDIHGRLGGPAAAHQVEAARHLQNEWSQRCSQLVRSDRQEFVTHAHRFFELLLAIAQALERFASVAAHLGFPELAVIADPEPRHPVLEKEVVRPRLHGAHGHFFADAPGNDDEGNIQRCLFQRFESASATVKQGML